MVLNRWRAAVDIVGREVVVCAQQQLVWFVALWYKAKRKLRYGTVLLLLEVVPTGFSLMVEGQAQAQQLESLPRQVLPLSLTPAPLHRMIEAVVEY